MNDPHVVALYYSVKHAKHVDYTKARPLEHHQPGFTVRLEDDRAEITMTSHHTTAEEARAEVEPHLCAWELTAALQSLPGEFEFSYDRANIIDRNQTPGPVHGALTSTFGAFMLSAEGHVSRSKYPDPPPAGIVRNEAVDLMFDRFCRYREGTTTLADAGYFCLTVLENSSGGRPGAASRYAIAKSVLDKLGDLTANKGGNEARKAAGSNTEFTPAEREWIDESIKRLILRAAEVAGDPSASRPQITLPDLPTLF